MLAQNQISVINSIGIILNLCISIKHTTIVNFHLTSLELLTNLWQNIQLMQYYNNKYTQVIWLTQKKIAWQNLERFMSWFIAI
jgi:hypothetical protein